MSDDCAFVICAHVKTVMKSEMMEIDNVMIQLFQGINEEDKEFEKRCSKIAADIVSKQNTIAQLVEDLGVYLVDKLHERRKFGTFILSTVISLIPIDFLSSTQLNFISTFYADRLKDHHEVVPAVLIGILAIAKHKNLPEGSCTTLLTQLFHNVSCQNQQCKDRQSIYYIFQAMWENRRTELQAMGLDFVYGVISAIENERDPKNLIFLFNWLPTFVKNAKLGHLHEEMFDIISCYFPVDFRVPAEETNGISRDSLATALTPCLCAIPEFAQFCIPLALEKLASNLRIAKLDSLHLLYSGYKSFPSDTYVENSTEIVSLIQKEVLSNNDSELEALCLKTLTKVINKISQNENDLMLNSVLSNLTDTLKLNMRPEVKLFEPTSKLLLSITEGSKQSATHVVEEIVPLLTNLYNITTTVEHKVKIFKTLMQFVVAHNNAHGNYILPNVLSHIPNMCMKAAIEDNSKLRAVGLLSLTIISKTLSEEMRQIFYENLKIYLTTPQDSEVRQSILVCLKTFANNYPFEIEDIINTLHPQNPQAMDIYMDSLAAIVAVPTFSERILSIIVNNCTGTIDCAPNALKTLVKIIQNETDITNYLIQNDFVNKIINWVCSSSTNATNMSALSNIGIILKSIIGKQSSNQQKEIFPCINLVANLMKTNMRLVFIIDGLICRLQQDVIQSFGLMDDLYKIALSNDSASDLAVQLLANMVNKLREDQEVRLFLNEADKWCQSEVCIERVVNVIAWITKALLMRGHELSDSWVLKLINLLEKHKEAAIGFKIVMKEDVDCLSLNSFCNKRLLYRQKFFMQVTNILSDKYNDDNKNFLLAIGYLLEEVQEQILRMHFDKVIKLVAISLSTCEDSRVLLSILTKIESFILAKDELSTRYMSEFISRLLHLAQFKPSMKVRIVALRCLRHFTEGFVLYKLLPLKNQVISTLGQCLDDHKRLVRKEAAETRLKWYLIDAPI